MPKEKNKVDINKHEIDIDTLFKQNVNDLSAIKELYRKLQEVEERISQNKYIDSTLAYKLKKEYEKLKKIILDENIQAKLYNDIETINSQLDTKVNQSDLEVERNRISEIIKNEGTSVDDVELQDIRVASNGKVYSSAGDSVRQQFNTVTNDLSSIVSHIFKGNVSSGYYNKFGELVPSNTGNWYATTKLPINSNNKYSYKGIATAGQDAVNIYWDKNKEFLGFIRFTQAEFKEINIDVFNDAKYISFSLHKDDVNTFDFIEKKELIENSEYLFKNQTLLKRASMPIVQGKITAEGPADADNRCRTYHFIDSSIVLATVEPTQKLYVCKYDKNKVWKSWYTNANGGYDFKEFSFEGLDFENYYYKATVSLEDSNANITPELSTLKFWKKDNVKNTSVLAKIQDLENRLKSIENYGMSTGETININDKDVNLFNIRLNGGE